MLAKRPKLAMTSSTPGKTLLINHFLINKEWYLVDLPTFERPINAYSGRLSCGHFSTFVLLTTNSALSISIILCFYT